MKIREYLAILLPVLFLGCKDVVPASQAADFRLVPVARFGSIDGELGLRTVTGIAVSPGQSRIYVTQLGVNSILVLSRHGDSLATIGRAGQGPGEFNMPGTPMWLGDTLWVPDSDRNAELFDSLGNFIEQRFASRPPLGQFQIAPVPLAPLKGGAHLLIGSAGITRVVLGTITEFPVVVIDSVGAVVDTISTISREGAYFSLDWPGGGGIVGAHPFPTAPILAVDPRGQFIVIAESGEDSAGVFPVRFVRVSINGDTTFTKELPFPAVPFTDPHFEKMIDDRFSSRTESGRITRAGLRRLLGEQLDLPAFLPPLSALRVSKDGSIWIRGPHLSPDSATVTVLNGPDLSVLGQTSVPGNVELKWVSMDEVWATALGRWREPYILRLEPWWSELSGGQPAVPQQ